MSDEEAVLNLFKGILESVQANTQAIVTLIESVKALEEKAGINER